MTSCKIDGCSKPAFCLGMCIMHYKRFKRHGDPLGGRKAFDGDLIAFIDAAVKSTTDKCIQWPYGTTKGYGRLKVNGRATTANRETCRRAHGEPPTPQHETAHSCNNRSCINPRHLRWATAAENVADMLGHGTKLRGEKVAWHVLTERQVREIVSLLGTTKQRQIAALFGVDESTVSSIKHGKSWGWLTGR